MEKIKELEIRLGINHNNFMDVLKKLRENSIIPEEAISTLERLARERNALNEEIKNVLMK